MVLTKEEAEITEFYREGMTAREIADCTGYRIYWIKKLLANEPKFAAIGYIFRKLPPLSTMDSTGIF